MSENNKSILLQGNAAIAAGNYEGFLALCSEDTIWNFVGEQTLHGKEAVRQYMTATYLEPPIVTVEQLIAENAMLTATGEISLKDKSGEMIHYNYCDVWRFNKGKMVELKAFVIEKKK